MLEVTIYAARNQQLKGVYIYILFVCLQIIRWASSNLSL